jgi:hypothetical protein
MKEIRERIAAIGLREAEEYGFVLAGGYAISANGMGDRPSMDVDLFTNRFDPDRFAEAVDRVRTAFAKVGKMSALWSRGEVRDFIDIDTVVTSGRFTREEVLAIGDQQEATPMDRGMLTERFESLSNPRYAVKYDPEQFANYGVDAEKRAAIIDRFGQWAAQIDPARAGERAADQERTAATPAVGMSEDLSAVRAAFSGSAREAVRTAPVVPARCDRAAMRARSAAQDLER